ncbi:hypothetical protein SJAV_03790 [Sulfurisphaera javensis]|uniref:Uncharacterized protein n=1 Tax=Sulfurisphaera javensis TaxID=2049879 RepID=A0AAT9GNH0_9CREN
MMLKCKDLNCVKIIAADVLKKEGIYKDFNVLITDLPFNSISKLDGNTVKINSVRFESFSVQSSGEYEISSSYLLIAIIYAFLNDVEKTRYIIKKYFGENSIVYRLIDIMFQ